MANAIKELLPTTHDYVDEDGDVRSLADDPDGFAAVGKGDFSTYEHKPAEAAWQQEVEHFLAADEDGELSEDDFGLPRREHSKYVTVRERELLAIREEHLNRIREIGVKAASAAALLDALDNYCAASSLTGMLSSPAERKKLTKKEVGAIERRIGRHIGDANEHLANGWGAHVLREAGRSEEDIIDHMVPVRTAFRGTLTAYGIRESTEALTAAQKVDKARQITNRRERYRRRLEKIAKQHSTK